MYNKFKNMPITQHLEHKNENSGAKYVDGMKERGKTCLGCAHCRIYNMIECQCVLRNRHIPVSELLGEDLCDEYLPTGMVLI